MSESKPKSENIDFVEIQTSEGVIKVRPIPHEFKTADGVLPVQPEQWFMLADTLYQYFGLDEESKPVVFKKKEISDQEGNTRTEMDPQGRWWKEGGKWMINTASVPSERKGLKQIEGYDAGVISWNPARLSRGTLKDKTVRELYDQLKDNYRRYASAFPLNGVMYDFLLTHPEEVPEQFRQGINLFFGSLYEAEAYGSTYVIGISYIDSENRLFASRNEDSMLSDMDGILLFKI